jgi:hypothetical protein
MSAEKLIKYNIKHIARGLEVDYDELKSQSKKIIKMARDFDNQLLGLMEDLLDLGNVGSIEELQEFDSEVLKMYCRIKDIDESSSHKKLVESVWNNMQKEYEIDSGSDSGSEDSDSEQDSDSDSGSETGEVIEEVQVEPEPVKKSKKKVKAETVIIE